MPEDGGQKKLGQILIEEGALSQENLKKALAVQKQEGGLLGEILVRLRMVKEDDVVVALATQFNYPYLAVENFAVNPQAAKSVPVDVVLKHTFIPIDKVDNTLTVVMADPSDEVAVREIETVTGCRIQAFVGTVSAIENAIQKQYKILTRDFKKTDRNKLRMTFKANVEEKPRKAE